MKPKFSPGKKLLLFNGGIKKVPTHEYHKMVNFYGVVLGLTRKDTNSSGSFESVTFEFGDKNLWVDKVSGISQAEVWL